uniref:NADP-dependent oxidoreductase domain-containing protein n=1 Tax=Rhizophagus irregularis (strain DAOM 181602 / DAOM 197198 / MUCL 43194) TaxID=747089 RepID=U9U7N0_RHIID
MTFLRELGKTGVKIPAIGLGCMGISEFYGSADEQENIKVLNRAIDIGCTFWDTAFAFSRGPNGEFKISGKPEYVRQACDNSLKRLGVNCIDL